MVPLNDLSRAWVAKAPEVREAVNRVLSSGWYVLGPETEAFEAELAAFMGVKHAVGLASGTDALRVAFLAAGCVPESEVVMAANAGGYAAVAAANIGCNLVYADVDPRTLLLTKETIEAVLGDRTRAVVVTHLFGNVADTQAIVDTCRPLGIAVIEDCAQSIGAGDVGRRVGSVGDIAAMSFYPTKNLGAAGDAGAVITDDSRLAAAVRQLRQYGWTDKYRIDRERGWNTRMDELQAAILRIGLPKVDKLTKQRRAIAARYREALAGSQIQVVTGETPDHVAHLAVVRSDRRSALAASLKDAGVATAVHYPVPDHRQNALPRPARLTDLAVTDRAAEEVLSVPCFPEMTAFEVDRVTDALASASRR